MISDRSFVPDDTAACLEMFDSNVPEFFAVREREDYERFLAGSPKHYHVYLDSQVTVAACGLRVDAERQRGRIQWIMTAASARGRGLGGRMMRDARRIAAVAGLRVIDISASQKSAPFFARFGALEVSREAGGWGPGLDRVEMVWRPAHGN